jgi:hypothetical protein
MGLLSCDDQTDAIDSDGFCHNAGKTDLPRCRIPLSPPLPLAIWHLQVGDTWTDTRIGGHR